MIGTAATVVHCRRMPFDVYIGRPSQFGNPFHVGDDGTRDEVIEMYECYARQRIAEEPEFGMAVKSLYGKVLGCWCVPLKCHGTVLVKLAEELNR